MTNPAMPFVRSIGSLSAASINMSVYYPSDYRVNDILVTVVRTEANSVLRFAENGWLEVPSGMGSVGNSVGANTQLSVWWKRATDNSTTTKTLTSGLGAAVAKMIAVGGVVEYGNPWLSTANIIQNSNTTTLTFPSVTSGYANTLVITGAAIHDIGGIFPLTSNISSTILQNTDTLFANGFSTYGCIAGGSGELANVATTDTPTANLSNNVTWISWSGTLIPHGNDYAFEPVMTHRQTLMMTGGYQDFSSLGIDYDDGVNDWSTGRAKYDDVILLFCTNRNNPISFQLDTLGKDVWQPINVPLPDIGTPDNGIKLYGWWYRVKNYVNQAANTAVSGFTMYTGNSPTIATRMIIRGLKTHGDPFVDQNIILKDTSQNVATFPTVTTERANSFLVHVVSTRDLTIGDVVANNTVGAGITSPLWVAVDVAFDTPAKVGMFIGNTLVPNVLTTGNTTANLTASSRYISYTGALETDDRSLPPNTFAQTILL